MKIVTIYEADDGTPFASYDDCEEYEIAMRDAIAATELLQQKVSLYNAIARFWEGGSPVNWTPTLTSEQLYMLHSSNKNTKIMVGRTDRSIYRATKIDHHGKILVTDIDTDIEKTISIDELANALRESTHLNNSNI